MLLDLAFGRLFDYRGRQENFQLECPPRSLFRHQSDMQTENESSTAEIGSLETVAQELKAELDIERLGDPRLLSLTNYPLSDKLRWTKERRGE